MSKGSPRVEFRVPREHHQLLRERAAMRELSVAGYVKEVVLASLGCEDEAQRSAQMRMEYLTQRIERMHDEVTSSLKSVEALAGAAVASAALLRDDETQPTPVAQEKVGRHVRVALIAAPSVIELHLRTTKG